jgi:hypothetical protein
LTDDEHKAVVFAPGFTYNEQYEHAFCNMQALFALSRTFFALFGWKQGCKMTQIPPGFCLFPGNIFFQPVGCRHVTKIRNITKKRAKKQVFLQS